MAVHLQRGPPAADCRQLLHLSPNGVRGVCVQCADVEPQSNLPSESEAGECEVFNHHVCGLPSPYRLRSLIA